MRRLVAHGLLALDCLLVLFWLIGFVLMALGKLQGGILEAHILTVFVIAVAQILGGLQCPLIIWRNQLLGSGEDILNPFLIQFGERILRMSHRTANYFLSALIFAGAVFYIVILSL